VRTGKGGSRYCGSANEALASWVVGRDSQVAPPYEIHAHGTFASRHRRPNPMTAPYLGLLIAHGRTPESSFRCNMSTNAAAAGDNSARWRMATSKMRSVSMSWMSIMASFSAWA